MNSENQKLIKQVFDLVIKYLETLQDDRGVINYESPEKLKVLMDIPLGKVNVSNSELVKYIEHYLRYSVRTGNKQFFNQLYAGFNLPGFLGEVIAALTNTSMYTYEVAPAATLMELEIINKMCAITGFENGEGTLVTGGSNSNLMAMLCARNKKIRTAKDEGITGEKKLTLFVSDQSHYSFEKGANLIGIGANNVIKVKSDKNGILISTELESEIQSSLERNEQPFMVAATTGTTLLGSYDPIEEMSMIAKKYDLWLHADGSWGGSVVLSNKHRHLVKGLELADSFAWNPHKLMNVPLITSAILFREKGTMQKNFSSGNTSYIFHEYDDQEYDLGPKSMQCGKRVDSLKLWLSWKYYGDSGYERRIDRLFEIAAYFENKIKLHPDFELLCSRQSLNVCFRYISKNSTDLNNFNLELRNNIMKSGKSLINYGYMDNTVAIRFVIVNPEVLEADIDLLINNILEEAIKIDV